MRMRGDRQALWCFRAALERLAEADAAGDRDDDALAFGSRADKGPRVGPSTLALDALMEAAPAQESPERACRLYQANAAPLQPDGDREQKEAERIIRFLASKPALSRRQLLRIRRNFARRYHPDRMRGASPEMAARHMAVINALVDEALRRATV